MVRLLVKRRTAGFPPVDIRWSSVRYRRKADAANMGLVYTGVTKCPGRKFWHYRPAKLMVGNDYGAVLNVYDVCFSTDAASLRVAGVQPRKKRVRKRCALACSKVMLRHWLSMPLTEDQKSAIRVHIAK